MIHRWMRRVLGLPRPRCRSDVESIAVELPDGVRLATTHVWPIGIEGRAPTVVLRSPYGTWIRPPTLVWLGRLLAEYGFHVVLQDVRGRYASEGEFEPFVNEAEDGAATLDWLETQSWSDGPVGLVGASYLAHCAWAATALRPGRVGALAIAIGSSDLYPLFYPHGVFSFANAVEWAAGVGRREGVDARQLDLDRAFDFEPVREADRVARCEVDFYRTWVDRPKRDDYWDRVQAPLPERAPPTLLIGGYWDFFLEPQLDDHAALTAQAAAGLGAAPQLLLGPWCHGPVAHRRFFRDGLQRRSLGRIVEHLDTHLAERTPSNVAPAVRFFVCDPGARGEWRDSPTWPPADAHTAALHLDASTDRARLVSAPATAAGRVEIEYDPSDPTPTIGGALFGWKAGSKDQGRLALRDDVAVLESAPLARDVVLAGPVVARLFVGADQAPADFAVHLIDAAPRGSLLEVGDGLARLDDVATPKDEPQKDEPHELVVSLGHRTWRFRAGHRVRIHVAPAHCPRFARARPPTLDDDEPVVSKQWVVTSAQRPSRVELTLTAGSQLELQPD